MHLTSFGQHPKPDAATNPSSGAPASLPYTQPLVSYFSQNADRNSSLVLLLRSLYSLVCKSSFTTCNCIHWSAIPCPAADYERLRGAAIRAPFDNKTPRAHHVDVRQGAAEAKD